MKRYLYRGLDDQLHPFDRDPATMYYDPIYSHSLDKCEVLLVTTDGVYLTGYEYVGLGRTSYDLFQRPRELAQDLLPSFGRPTKPEIFDKYQQITPKDACDWFLKNGLEPPKGLRNRISPESPTDRSDTVGLVSATDRAQQAGNASINHRSIGQEEDILHAELLELGRKNQARLVEVMKDRQRMTCLEVGKAVHDSEDTRNDAIRKNVIRVNKTAEGLGLRIRYKCKSEHVFKEHPKE